MAPPLLSGKQMKQYLEIGEIVTTHGVGGELKLYPWCDGAGQLKTIKAVYLDEAGAKRLEVEGLRTQKNMNLIKLKGYDAVETARALVGRTLYASRDELALPKGRYFVADLLGCRILDADTGEDYGTLCEVTDNGAHGIYHVRRADDEVRMLPAVEPFLVSTDVEAGEIRIRPIEGMMTDAD